MPQDEALAVEMRLVICGAGVVIGLVMVVAGVRLWLGSSPAGDTGPTFATSALIFLLSLIHI